MLNGGKSKVFLAILALLISLTAHSQYFSGRTSYWKNQRHSIGFGLGIANFLGELGGRDQVGSDFIWDLEFSETRPALQINYRYQLGSRVFAKAQFAFGYIGGNDALTEEIFRRNRNLHFRSSIFEFNIQGEVNVIDLTPRNLYDRGIKQRLFEGTSIYLAAGVGISRFNPQGNFNGEWYDLRDFGTEGQYEEDGPELYSRYTLVIPLGVGVRFQLDRQWTVGLEVSHRITFTDYMDDVSTVYYDNEVIRETQGELAAYFADPSLGYYVEDGVQIPLNSTETGMQRGDSEDNDAYFYTFINASYKISEKRFKRGRGRITKRRQRRVVF